MTNRLSDCSYQLDAKLPDHLDLQVDDVSVTGDPEQKETHQDRYGSVSHFTFIELL